MNNGETILSERLSTNVELADLNILIHHYESTEGDQRCLLSKETYPSIITQMMTD